MAKIIDPLDNQQELNLQEHEELVNLFDTDKPKETKVAESPQTTTEETKTEESSVPDKYQGKSIEEIVQMHQEAEKLVGRQSSEVGELRKIVDDFIKTKADETKQPEVPDNSSVDDLDFFENPNEAVSKAVSNSSEMKQMKELLAKTKQQEVLAQLQSQHPDYVDVIQDDEFANWVKASDVRIELLQRADKYDLNAANELLTNWKQIKGVKQVTQQDRKQQIKAASTGGKGSGEPTSRKIYKRTDIVQLMISDPERYKANVDEFDRAYREGRVK